MATDFASIAAAIPAGSYAIAVSGGADSTALLTLLALASHLRLHVVHLDHETRGIESDGDAEFVRAMASQLGLPYTIARFSEFAEDLKNIRNASARFRQARLALFRRVVEAHQLAGVLVAHHADDNAETVLQRLLRGSGQPGLAGMAIITRVTGVTIYRPMLQIRRREIIEYLDSRHQSWREDQSNRSDKYFRNRLRRLLERHPALTDDLLAMADAFSQLNHWIEANAPQLPAEFWTGELVATPQLLARAAIRRWLIDRGSPSNEISPQVIQRLLEMCLDAATPPRAHFPGQVLVSRRRGTIAAHPITLGKP